jgi:molecular chaperone DnaK (HSP70)
MPMVREMLTRVVGKKPLLHDPDECVALGAALQAHLLQDSGAMEQIKIGHVLSHSLGIATKKEGRIIIDQAIPALTPLPCAQVRTNYTTTADGQTSVHIPIYEGESDDPDAYSNGPIGIVELDANPPRPTGQPKISVEFRCDENGRITALARDVDTGRESRTMIALNAGRKADEVEVESRLLSEAVIS